MHPDSTDLYRRISTVLDTGLIEVKEACFGNETTVEGTTVDVVVVLTPPILSQSTLGEYDDDINA